MATAVRLGPLGPFVAATLAVGFLAVMAVSGRLREGGQFVPFVPDGLMPLSPDQVDRVELIAAAGRWVFARGPQGWRAEDHAFPVPAALASHLEASVKFMHVSPPVRVLPREDWAPQGLREFGLDPPTYTATLFHQGRAVLSARFGQPNPQKVLQYVWLEGRDEVYLMSRFVGQEWEAVVAQARAGQARDGRPGQVGERGAGQDRRGT